MQEYKSTKRKLRSKADGHLLVYCDECKFDDGSGKCQSVFHKWSSQPYTYPNGSLCWAFQFKEELLKSL